jgi:Ferritin-like
MTRAVSPRTVSPSVLNLGPRPAACRETDSSALRAIAQAAVNVELFTVPLYMGTLYSIQGMHQITGECQDFYKGRLWPGPATTADPKTDNECAFNIIFSVLIEEMLHIEMAANIASAIGVKPTFTGLAPPDSDKDKYYAWTCYGPDKTVIPHIVDLKDINLHNLKDDNLQDAEPDEVRVNLAALSANQVLLFRAIEQPEEEAKKNIKQSALSKYFPDVPFKDWAPDKTENDLPMFGTIGHMYQCYYDYMNLRYEDNEKKGLWDYVFKSAHINLRYEDNEKTWDYVFKSGSRQNDLFNVGKISHPKREFCGFETTVTGIGVDPTNSDEAFARVVTMMDAITDQGEGSELKKSAPTPADLQKVKSSYQASREALEIDYPRYRDTGQPADSADAVARSNNGARDHYERFTDLGGLVDKVETWPMWHKKRGPQPPWTAGDLHTLEYNPDVNPYGLPSPEAIAQAMNDIGSQGSMHDLFSKVAVGSIAGITTVLNKYWDPGCEGVLFPYPSMVGSGDRMAICWALFGKAPDLSQGMGQEDEGGDPVLLHACQGLDFQQPGNKCAPVKIFHSCRGSNGCKAQGGCGFVQKITGGGMCGFALVAAKAADGDAGDGVRFSAPSDNKCATFGGCAVPISASQILPQGGTMELFDFAGTNHDPVYFDTMSFQKGEKVYDVAYRAYQKVMKYRNPLAEPPPKPEPGPLRLAFPPST